jgi:hypothetical protein
MGVHKATLTQAGATLGDTVRVTIERDPDPLPADRDPREAPEFPPPWPLRAGAASAGPMSTDQLVACTRQM